MTTNVPLASVLHGALLSAEVATTEDRSLIFIVDRLPRTCSRCGTVFSGSASGMALAGADACPYCGRPGSLPVVCPEVA